MKPDEIQRQNLSRIKELKESVQWAAVAWLQECAELGLLFRISEAFRPQSVQDKLYEKGRTTKGKIVTWTRSSMHTQRLAVDAYPYEGTYAEIEKAGMKYGIYRPKELVKLGDLGHFQFDKVGSPPVPEPTFAFPTDPKEQAKIILRRIRRLRGDARARAMQRYVQRYGPIS